MSMKKYPKHVMKQITKEPDSATSNMMTNNFLKSSQRQYSVDSYGASKSKFQKKLNLNKTPDKIWVQQLDSGAKV